MATRPPAEISERAFSFACDVYDYCADLVALRGLPARIGYQLFDAASSVGANRAEAESAYSRKDFRSRNSISLRESRESRFWLRLANAKNLGVAAERQRLLQEANELVAIFRTIVKRLDGSAGSLFGTAFVLPTSDFRLPTSDFLLLLRPIHVSSLPEEHLCRLHHRLGQRRVGMDRQLEVGRVCAHLDREDAFGDQLAGAGADGA